MIVLDTNIVSAMMRPQSIPAVLTWLDTQPTESIWTTSVTLFEIRLGLAVLPPGKRRTALELTFERILKEGLEHRVLDFDAAAALVAADLMADLRASGRGIELRDLQIAGIVASRRATLVTRTTRHFIDAGIDLIDPCRA